jgi:hypothetical protein
MSRRAVASGVLVLGVFCALVRPSLSQPTPPESKTMTPEQAFLKGMEGTWEVKLKWAGGSSVEASLVETRTLIGAGFWLHREMKGVADGAPYLGHGLFGYETAEQTFEAAWADSASPHLTVSKGSWDAAHKAISLVYEEPGPSGPRTKFRQVLQAIDADHQALSFWMTGTDGKEVEMITVSFTRKKDTR